MYVIPIGKNKTNKNLIGSAPNAKGIFAPKYSRPRHMKKKAARSKPFLTGYQTKKAKLLLYIVGTYWPKKLN